jgi:hypothetical protein
MYEFAPICVKVPLMNNLESATHWRQYSVGIVLALFISFFALHQFHLLRYSFSLALGCMVLFLALVWNIYLMKLAQSRSEPGWHHQFADGLMIAGLLLVFIGTFF